MIGTPTLQELRSAREQFADLIASRAAEAEFQALFTRCPYVLSEALPLRLRPFDIRPLARPGQSDPDFIFFSRSRGQLDSFGVIEIKRPSTTLLTTPRMEVALLSRDAATAVAQGQRYCQKLGAELTARLTSNVIIGANDYIFVIAGLTDELTRKLGTAALLEAVKSQIPSRCQIIPYDELLRRFESTVPPLIFSLSPIRIPDLYQLEQIVSAAKGCDPEMKKISKRSMRFWCAIEDRWRAGSYVGTGLPLFIDRDYWCVSGTNQLALESPAHLDFPIYVRRLVTALESSLHLHRLLVEAQGSSHSVTQLKRLLSPRQVEILSSAVERCREKRDNMTFLDLRDVDVEVLTRLELVKFGTIESCDAWYYIDSLILQLWS
jgi:hypothetical protein